MRGLLIFASLQIAIFTSSFAVANPVSLFATSLQTEVAPLKMNRFIEIGEHIWLALPSRLERWGIINTDAAASYNGLINTIILKDEAMTYDESGHFQLPSMTDLKTRFRHAYSVTASVIFHEMAHAEYDIFVEQEDNLEDLTLHQTLETQVYPWLQRNYPQLSFLTLKVALSEIFAYYHGDLLSLIMDDLVDILYTNGYSFSDSRCYKNKYLTEQMALLPAEKFKEILPSTQEMDLPYSKKMNLDTIWVRGEEIALVTKNANDPFKPEWMQALWSHFYSFYSPPRTKRELLTQMQQMPYWSKRISACHESLLRPNTTSRP